MQGFVQFYCDKILVAKTGTNNRPLGAEDVRRMAGVENVPKGLNSHNLSRQLAH